MQRIRGGAVLYEGLNAAEQILRSSYLGKAR